MPEFNETGEAFLGNNMKRGIVIVLSLCAIVAAAYFSGSKWLIRHETMTFFDKRAWRTASSINCGSR